MEKAPNPSLFNSGNRIVSAPPDRSEPTELKMAKRRALAQWYESRRAQARNRYRSWTMRRSQEVQSGSATFDVMGRMAVVSAANAEPDAIVRRQRRAFLMRKWQQFMRNAF